MQAPDPPKLVFIGKVTRPHGVRGELKVLAGEGSTGAWRAAREVWLGEDRAGARAYQVRRARPGGRLSILALEGVDSAEAAEALRELKLFVARDQLVALEEGEFYTQDLIGLQVEDRAGRVLGRLEEVFDNGAHDVYAVRRGDREILIPAVAGVVLSVELDTGRMVVDPPEGLPGLE